MVSVQNNCSSNPLSGQSVLTRAQSKIGEGAFPTDACGLHKKQSIQVMDGLTFTEPTRSRPGCPEPPLWKLIKYARDL